MAGLAKKIWIIANWKSNKNIAEALDWVSYVGPKLPKNDNLKICVCPTFSVIPEVKKAILVGNFPLMIGSQDLSPFEAGAYTGEEAASLMKGLIDLAILGHSERRQNFSETDEMVEKKAKQALANNITPLVCVQGEDALVPEGCSLVAYEPIWAISTGLNNTPGVGRADNPEEAGKVASIIKREYGSTLEVIYGGSVSSDNAKGFTTQENISGVLIGGKSLDSEEFIKICKLVAE